MVKRIFLSHADSDSPLARLLHDEIRRARPDIEVFVSSVPGAIPTGTEWLPEIKRQLKAADAYLALLTPASVQRQWVWFESGAAFMSDKLFVGVCASGLRKSAVPSPLSGQQLLSFDSPGECVQVFTEFGVPVDDAAALWQAIHAAAQSGAERLSKSESWIGVEQGGRFFAWDGPLDGLDDKDAIVCPPGLPDTLRGAGMTPTFGNADRLQQHLADGRLQVFLTDSATWKRPVVNDGKQLLLVHGTRDTTPTAFDAARQLQQRNEARQRKAAMLHTDAVARAATDEFYRFADAVDVLVKQLTEAGVPLDVARFPEEPSLRIRYANAFRVTVGWLQPYINTLNESRLIVAEWKGGDASRVIHRHEDPLDQKTFFFDVSPEGEYAWRDESNEFFSDVRLADWCVTRLLKRATPETI
jgi:hypothetical protein